MANDRQMREAEALPDEDVSILFVEDDPAVAEMYKLKLDMDGYRVTIVHSGEDALQRVREHLPDIVFLDVRLPRMDGLAILKELRADDLAKHLPVIVLSAYGETELKERGLELGALEYLIKSEATPASLSRGVDAWIRS